MLNNAFWSAIDPDALDRIGSRRDAVREMVRVGRTAALASIPVALAASAKPAFGQSLPQNVIDVLNFALTLEYLENEFYIQGLATSGLIPGVDRAVFETIQAHEQAHVEFLAGALGSAAVAKPTFDFTAGGALPTFTDYTTFKLLSQAFEDTGVRAYKGQAPALVGNDAILEAALTIHSVEARHAAHVRRMNGYQGWIPLDQPGAPAAIQATYAGEEDPSALGINFLDVANVSIESATEAFDEPLSMADTLAIAGQFIV